MPNYIISYDAPSGTDYQSFYDAISKHDASHLLESVWLFSTSSSALEVRNWAKSLLGANSSVAVIQIQGDWAISNVNKHSSDWLENHP